ncbi:MAG: hypothetical protein ACUVRU_07660 [Anaerolineae bacterium]
MRARRLTPIPSTGKTFDFEISADDNVQFSQVLLKVEAGSRVSVTLVNNSKDKQFQGNRMSILRDDA